MFRMSLVCFVIFSLDPFLARHNAVTTEIADADPPDQTTIQSTPPIVLDDRKVSAVNNTLTRRLIFQLTEPIQSTNQWSNVSGDGSFFPVRDAVGVGRDRIRRDGSSKRGSYRGSRGGDRGERSGSGLNSSIIQLSPCRAIFNGGVIDLGPLQRLDGSPRFVHKDLELQWVYNYNPCTSYNVPSQSTIRLEEHLQTSCYHVAFCAYKKRSATIIESRDQVKSTSDHQNIENSRQQDGNSYKSKVRLYLNSSDSSSDAEEPSASSAVTVATAADSTAENDGVEDGVEVREEERFFSLGLQRDARFISINISLIDPPIRLSLFPLLSIQTALNNTTTSSMSSVAVNDKFEDKELGQNNDQTISSHQRLPSLSLEDVGGWNTADHKRARHNIMSTEDETAQLVEKAKAKATEKEYEAKDQHKEPNTVDAEQQQRMNNELSNDVIPAVKVRNSAIGRCAMVEDET